MNLQIPNEPTRKFAMLSPGEKIHVMQRRRFEKDVRRHFVGEVRSLLVTNGSTWTMDVKEFGWG